MLCMIICCILVLLVFIDYFNKRFFMPEGDHFTRSHSNIATTQILNHIKPPDRFSSEDDPSKFVKELKNYYELLQLVMEQQTLQIIIIVSRVNRPISEGIKRRCGLDNDI